MNPMKPNPGDRPVQERRTARVLLTDPEGRVLLFADSDPGVPGYRWWITPGGGIEPGESDAKAALRELHDETGLRLHPGKLHGPVATRSVWHGYTDKIVRQRETFFAATVPVFELDLSGHTDDERLTMTAHRWWSRDDLAATDEAIWPRNLVQLLDLPAGPEHPAVLEESEESSLPVSAADPSGTPAPD